jgi:hypothetical protein
MVDMGAFEYQPVYLDIIPRHCPNEDRASGSPFLTVALVGTETFDVGRVHHASIRLSRADHVETRLGLYARGRSAIRTTDVASPVQADLCACSEDSDGIDDKVFRFDAAELEEAFQWDDVADGQSLQLILSGTLTNNAPFSAADCITVEKRIRPDRH